MIVSLDVSVLFDIMPDELEELDEVKIKKCIYHKSTKFNYLRYKMKNKKLSPKRQEYYYHRIKADLIEDELKLKDS